MPALASTSILGFTAGFKCVPFLFYVWFKRRLIKRRETTNWINNLLTQKHLQSILFRPGLQLSSLKWLQAACAALSTKGKTLFLVTESRLIRDVMRDVKIVQSVHWGLKKLVKPSSQVTLIYKNAPNYGCRQHFKHFAGWEPWLTLLLFAPVRACCCAFRKTNGEGGIGVGFKAPISCLWDVSLYIQHRTSPNKQRGSTSNT